MNRIEGGEEHDERTAEEELARSTHRPAEAIKHLKKMRFGH
ncbi:MAG: hypothetical protein OEY31_13820 [Candidatus Bathyarchaeota archaeon]|nr:hypothetical protein [Candidatus Bathyarchaeota archaeon]